jgi:hypothetical protein
VIKVKCNDVQVQSRVQKYFLKLQKAGLPIPGRLPPSRNTYRYFTHNIKRKSAMARQPPLASSRKSTFFASIVPSVKMEAGLRIRIHFIRIQHFRLNTDPDPGLG